MIFAFFGNFDRDFRTLGIELAEIRLQIRTRQPRIRLYGNFRKFRCIISLKNNQFACFFSHPVFIVVLYMLGFIGFLL